MIITCLQVKLLVLHTCSEIVSFPFSLKEVFDCHLSSLKHLESLSVKCEDYNEFIFPSVYQNVICFCLGFYSYNYHLDFLHYNLMTMYLKSSKYTGVYQLSCLILGIFPDSYVINSRDLQTGLSFACSRNINCQNIFLTRVHLMPITSFSCF